MTEARLYLDAVIAPNRSLPLTGLWVLLGALTFVNLVVGTMFLVMGAWPAPIFLGLDVLAIAVAFWVSYRQGRPRERVQVSADHVRVMRDNGGEARTVWTSPTAFTRVDLEETGRHGLQVRLRLSGKRVTIGGVLSPPEREDLAEAVERAIRSARAERWES